MPTKKTFKKKSAKPAAKKQSSADQWKPDFGEGAKPKNHLHKLVTGYEPDKDGNLKMQGVTIGDFAKTLCDTHKFTGDNDKRVVTSLIRAESGEGCNSPEDVCPANKFLVVIDDVKSWCAKDEEVRSEFSKAVEDKTRKEEEKKASMLKAGQTASKEEGSKLAILTKKTESAISKSLSEVKGITLKDGKFVLSPDMSNESIATGFAKISGMVDQVEGMRESYTMMEARFAQAISDTGREWALFFDPDEEDQYKSIKRIKQAVGALNKLDKYKVDMPGASITTIRNAMEAKYNKDNDEDNAERARKVVKILTDHYDKNGKYPPLNEVRNIVAEHKVQGGTKRHTHVYIFASPEGELSAVGMSTLDSGMASLSVCIYHPGSQCLIVGDADPAKVVAPDDELLKLAEENSAPDHAQEQEEEGEEWKEGMEEEDDAGLSGEFDYEDQEATESKEAEEEKGGEEEEEDEDWN